MEDILHFDSVTKYNAFNNNQTLHPLVGVVHLDQANPRKHQKLRYDFYTIFLKKVHCGDLRYGLDHYDYDEGTLVFLAPGQVIGQNADTEYQPQGLALVFHPDYLLGSTLAKEMEKYHFFSYSVNEALHLSDQERKVITDCFANIEFELQRSIDKHSKQLILSNIELFLNYCSRFYDRQFITRESVNKGILGKFEQLLNGYYASNRAIELGLPSVAYFAEQLHISSNYFGDLIKKETGKSAQEYIQNKIMEMAKNKLYDSEKTVQNIASELGFKYPQHFARLFKKRTGFTPQAFRQNEL